MFFSTLSFSLTFFCPMDAHVHGRAADRFRIWASRIEGRRPVDERDDGDRERWGDVRPRLDCGSQSRYESRREKLHFLLARINGGPRVISFKQTATIPSSVLRQPREPFAYLSLPSCVCVYCYVCMYMMDALITVRQIIPAHIIFEAIWKLQLEMRKRANRTGLDLKSLILFDII